MMVKKTQDGYSSSTYNAIPDHIAYDRKLYEGIAPYIQEHLWKHMDKDRVKKAVFVLDDPLMEYGNGNDYEMVKMVLKNFLPKVKKLLKIDKNHKLKDMLWEKNIAWSFVDRNIKQRFDLYISNKTTRGGIVQILQEWPKKNHIDLTQKHTKRIINDTVPNTQKSIIANIMILMILEEEMKEHMKNMPNKIVHTFEDTTETE